MGTSGQETSLSLPDGPVTGRLLSSLVTTLVLVSPGGATPSGRPPVSCADSIPAVLAPFTGTWTVQAVFLHPDGQTEAWPGEALIHPDLGGCVLVEHLRTRRDSLPFEVLAVWGAPDGGATFQRLLSHSQHGLLGLYQRARVAGTLYLDYLGKLPDSSTRLRHVIRQQGPNDFVFESQRSRGGSAWRAEWRVEYRRQHTR